MTSSPKNSDNARGEDSGEVDASTDGGSKTGAGGNSESKISGLDVQQEDRSVLESGAEDGSRDNRVVKPRASALPPPIRKTLSGVGGPAKRNISLPIPRPRASTKLGRPGASVPPEDAKKSAPGDATDAGPQTDRMPVPDTVASSGIAETADADGNESPAAGDSCVEPKTDRMSAPEAADAVEAPSNDILPVDSADAVEPATIEMSAELFEQDSDDDLGDEFEAEPTIVSESPLLQPRVEPLESVESAEPVAPSEPVESLESIDFVEPIGGDTGDFEGEKTEVFDSPFEHEVLSARLTALSGPCAGQDFLLNRERNTIGRGQNNTIALSDIAMSRQHFEIRQEADQSYLLIDLQSANGTLLNHTRIVEAELRHGDRVEAGKSELQFVQPGNRVPARTNKRHLIAKREPVKPRRAGRVPKAAGVSGEQKLEQVLTWIIRGAAVLIVLLGATVLVLHFNPVEPATVDAPAPVSETSPGHLRVQSLYLDGVEKVKDRDWTAASALFEQVEAIDAQFANVGAQLARVESERRVLASLQEARGLLEEQNFSEAIKILDTITNQSVYMEDASRLLREARQRRVAARLQQAQEALAVEEFDEASALLDAVLDEVPEHKGALELKAILQGDAEKVAEKVAAIEAEKAQAKRRASRGARSSDNAPQIDWFAEKKDSKRSSDDGGAKEKVQINFTRGFSLYRAGKFSQASRYLRDSAGSGNSALARRAAQTAEQIDAFAKIYAAAQRAMSGEDWAGAIKELKRAQTADRKVASSAYFKRRINAHLATSYAKIWPGGRGALPIQNSRPEL